MRENIIVIGAGIAGLVAARKLSAQYKVTILEARERTGGRILQWNAGGFTKPIEGGAEFIHGQPQRTFALLDEAGIAYKEMSGKMYSVEDGKWEQQSDMIEGWDKLLDKMKEVKDETTMQQLLDTYFSEPKYSELYEQAKAYTEGFDIADVDKITVRSLYQEWNEPQDAYRIKGGYTALVQYLESECKKNGCEIITGAVVEAFTWQKDHVTVHTAGNTFEAAKCILTIPTTLFANGSIQFDPAIHEYMSAARDIGFGAVVKVIMEFKEVFWKQDMAFVFADEPFPTWWSQTPFKDPILTGWAGGPKAKALSGLNDSEILDIAIQALANIYSMDTEELKKKLQAAKVFNWQQDEYSLGAYSYAIPGSSAARLSFSNPVDNTIYFTGEAVYDGPSSGTVEAAIVSAELTASLILS